MEYAIIEPRTVTPEQLGPALGITAQTLRLWAREGRKGPPFSRQGNRIFYRVSDVEKWQQANTHDPEGVLSE